MNLFNEKAVPSERLAFYTQDIKGLVEEFKEALLLATSNKPLTIILDSLDQLDASDKARRLGWLPTTLPGNVKLLVSTLPDEQYECFPKLQVSKACVDIHHNTALC